MNRFTITTSIAYTNAPPHIGFALELMQADVLARFHRQKGSEVFFLTGTDEHGTKIERAARDAGKQPQDFADAVSERFRELTRALNISNDDFIRTTDQERHWPAVKELWSKLKESGDLYRATYEGLYCSGCEAFITEKELVDRQCPHHKKEPEKLQEENWFFKLSKYGDQLKKKIEANEFRIIPESKKNEILSLIDQGLYDVSFSRPKEKLQWGIPVPQDDSSVVYVWADALTNYISALGYPNGENFNKYWPADLHVVGPDIVRFHATIWPAMLLSAGIDLPRAVFVHGFLTVDGQKMSKSIGNVVDPFELIEKYGADAVRYFFLREIPPTEDGDFSREKLEGRYNSDLAGGLGNLLSRVLAMAEKQEVKAKKEIANQETREWVEKTKQEVEHSLGDFRFHDALAIIWELISHADRRIDKERPWEGGEESKSAISDLLLVLREISDLLIPFLPQASESIKEQLLGNNRKPLFPRLT